MLRRIKSFLLSFCSIRRMLYSRVYGLDRKTSIGNLKIRASNRRNLVFNSNNIGDCEGEAVSIMLKHNARLEFGKLSFVREGVKFQLEGNSICTLGEMSYINPNTIVSGGGNAKIIIGANCAIAWGVNLLAYDYHCLIQDSKDSIYFGNIIIENHVWVGAGVTILKNVTIGENCIIGANSLVIAGNYPPNSLIVGNPARVIKSEVNWRNLKIEEKLGNG